MEMQAKIRPSQGAALMALVLVIFMTLPGQAARAQSCANADARKVYDSMKAATLAHKTYTSTYSSVSERGARHEVYARIRAAGKYIQSPAKYWEQRLSVETSFPEQAGPGYQEIYDGTDDMTRLMMPGALRVLGVILMYPEDPKADYLNGENLNAAAVWTWFPEWDRMMEGGRLELACAERKGKNYQVLTIHRGKNPDPLYHHDTVKLWIDPALDFPMIIETFAAGDPKPVRVYEFEELKLDQPLTASDLDFQGLAPGWNLVSVPGGPHLASLERQEPRITDDPAVTAASFFSMLDQALAPVTDYRATMTVSLRYFRLRLLKTDEFRFLRPGAAFSLVTRDLEANYLLINAGEDFRTVYDKSRDPNLHILPAGIYRVTGEQSFPPDDPRIFTAMGDNPFDLNFFALRDILKSKVDAGGAVKAGVAASGELSGPYLEVREKGAIIPKRPSIMRLMLDDKTHLPARLEYRGYDDPAAFLAVSFSNVKVNQGIKSADLWE
jgi:outer membrane lipoprotein-sorting protein